MPSLIFAQRAHKFAEELGDSATSIQIETYLHQSDLPGPTVMIVGAEGRGKSVLFGKAAGVVGPPSGRVRFAGGGTWKKTVSDMAVAEAVFLAAEAAAIGDVLLCDAPSISDKLIPSLLTRTDFAIMAVQITQPSGADEVAFVRQRLTDIPAVLVLTKCDQADDEDFADGLDAALEVYGDFSWEAVLLSDKDGGMEARAASGDSRLTFESWWGSQGQARAEQARRSHLDRLSSAWRARARKVLDEEEQHYTPLLEVVLDARTVSSTVTQAFRIQDDLMSGLKALPEVAIAHYRKRLPDLRLRVSQCTNSSVDRVKADGQIDPTAIGQALATIYKEWDQEARSYVRDEISLTVERLHEAAARYEELVRAAAKVEATVGAAPSQSAEALLNKQSGSAFDLQGEFGPSISDMIRVTATPVVSGLGTGLLLFSVIGALLGPFAPVLALLGGGIAGLGMHGMGTEAVRRKASGNLREAIQRQAVEQEHAMQQLFQSEWNDFTYGVRESLAASKRRLAALVMHQSTSKDSEMAAQHAALTRNLSKIASLKTDLQWLEQHEGAAKLIIDAEE